MELKKEITIRISDSDHGNCNDWCVHMLKEENKCGLFGVYLRPLITSMHGIHRCELCKEMFKGVFPDIPREIIESSPPKTC